MTPKERMLCAYRGLPADRMPVAPEFWYYYPAKILGMDMIAFEKDIPFWKALQSAFQKFKCDGWGAYWFPSANPNIKTVTSLKDIGGGRFREDTSSVYRGKTFTSVRILDKEEPSWNEKNIADNIEDLRDVIEMALDEGAVLDYADAEKALNTVGGDYLLEMWLGAPFFDFIAMHTGFENAVMYFNSAPEKEIETFRQRLTEERISYIRKVCANTGFESFVFGCAYSCNSLIGPHMWRKWDKPFLKAVADEIHRHGKLLHIHFHGRSLDAVADFPEIGIDCVCPFERGPGGDVDGLAGLKEVRKRLNEKVTMNGNVHTVETLIRGNTADVRREVREIKEAFSGSNRCIIGTGDQVGRETPEENIAAMIEEAVK